MKSNPAVLFYCRAGFEKEVAGESATWLAPADVSAEFATGQAFVVQRCTTSVSPARLRSLRPDDLVFARQAIVALPQPVLLGDRDRVTPLVEAARELAAVHGIKRFQSVWVEYPDTNEGKTLSQLSRGLTPYLEKALGGLLAATDRESARLHVFLTSKSTAWVGWTMPGQGSDWLLGIPRVRMPAGAPSRSTLKLAEAFMIFLGEDEPRLLQADMRAVDLGAAPGGWTWQLIQRGIRVTAVDNGKLSSDLVDNAMVKHLQSDGFHFIPKKPVDWLVCDMVEKPSRIAALVAHWIAQGWAQRALFNLKLPMKKRLDEVRRCETLMREALDESGKHYVLRFKQLYHDREEVTGYCAIASRRR